MSSPGGYGGPRPGDFGGCTYRPMGTPPPRPEHDPSPSGGCWGCAVPAMVLAAVVIAILL